MNCHVYTLTGIVQHRLACLHSRSEAHTSAAHPQCGRHMANLASSLARHAYTHCLIIRRIVQNGEERRTQHQRGAKLCMPLNRKKKKAARVCDLKHAPLLSHPLHIQTVNSETAYQQTIL